MKHSLVYFCLYLLPFIDYAQQQFFVSPNGNNSNTGNISNPFLTIQHAWNQLSAGDTLNILAGTYNEKIQLNSSGTGASRITIRSYHNQLAVISGAGIISQDAVIAGTDLANVNIIGLEIANNIQNDAQGIALDGKPQNITIASCKIHDIHFSANPNALVSANTNAQGIIIFGNTAGNVNSHILITDNELYNCRLGYSEGIAINGNIDGFEISHNHVHDLTNIGIDALGHEGVCPTPAFDQARHGVISNNLVHDCLSPYATSGGLYIDGAKAVIIERNITHHNGYGIEVGCENMGKSADSVIVRNNFIYDNEVSGIALGGYDYLSGSGKVINAIVESNTLFMNDYTNSGSGELLISYVENARVYNNIINSTSQNLMLAADVNTSNIHLGNNLYYTDAGLSAMEFYWQGNTYTGLGAYQTALNQDQHSIYALPQFISTTLPSPNLHLQSTSTCINNGANYTNDLQQLDIDGEARYSDAIDIGADEYYSPTGLNDANEIKVQLYPNPVRNICYINTENVLLIQLYDIAGKLLLQQQNTVINLNAYIDGLYLLRVHTQAGIATKRIVKTAFGRP